MLVMVYLTKIFMAVVGTSINDGKNKFSSTVCDQNEKIDTSLILYYINRDTKYSLLR